MNFTNKTLRKFFLIYSRFFGFFAKVLNGKLGAYPSKITFKITNICNVDCYFCYNSGKNIQEERKIELPVEEWKKVIDQVPFYTAISFTGGEVFLYPKFFELIDYIGKRKLKCSVVTSANTLSEKDLEKIIDSKLYYLMISLHGLESTHNRTLGGSRNYFQHAIDVVKKLNKIKAVRGINYPVIGIKTVLNTNNYKELLSLMEMCENELRVSHFYFNLLTNEPFEIYDDLNSSLKSHAPIYSYPESKKDEIIEVINQIEVYSKKSKMDIGFTNEFKSYDDLRLFIAGPSKFKVRSCLRPYHEIYIQPNGDILTCIKYRLGNIRNSKLSLQDLYKKTNHSKLLEIFSKNKHNVDYCRSCLEAPFEQKKN